MVWLADPKNQGRHADLLLVRRILTPRERLMVQVSDDPDRMLWSLWAAKEAAFKAVSREHPGTKFSPVQFEVYPPQRDAPAFVTWGSVRLPVFWAQGPDWVHAWVYQGAGRPTVVVEPRAPGDEEGPSVRRLALRALADAGLGAGTIEGLPPVFVSPDRAPLPVSLSHDGPWVAVAFGRPGS